MSERDGPPGLRLGCTLELFLKGPIEELSRAAAASLKLKEK